MAVTRPNLEEEHKRSIELLVKEFGSSRKEHIGRIYAAERQLLERAAKITKYLAVVTYKVTRDILRAEFERGYAEKKAEKFEHKKL